MLIKHYVDAVIFFTCDCLLVVKKQEVASIHSRQSRKVEIVTK